jgi:hypothetical protein
MNQKAAVTYTCRDLIVQSTGPTRAPVEIYQRMPPIKERFSFTESLWVGPIKEDIRKIFDACEPIGFGLNATRQYGYRYCFAKEVTSETYPSIQWDKDGSLRTLVMLSRLIHPTTASSHHSVRVIYKCEEVHQIIPGQTNGYGAFAYVPREDWRNWITLEEAAELKVLLAAYEPNKLPPRLNRALRHYDFAQLNPFPDQKIVSVVTALEAALQTSNNSVSKQFRERVPRLGECVAIAITGKEAGELYDDRSGFVHGAGVDWTTRKQLSLRIYEKAEMLLRKTLVKAIVDSSFANVFETTASVQERFPVVTYL